MQKLRGKLKNAPPGTPLALRSASTALNREETLSVPSKVRTRNNLEVAHRQRRGGSDPRVQNIVYVLNMRGKPLMPTVQAKARRLLKGGKAVVVKRFPFTIKLAIATGETKQDVILGVDAGYELVGISATSKKSELFSAEVSLRKDIIKLLSNRKEYRRERRNRGWYRESRFNNRIASRRNGWFAPSIMHKIQSHVRIIDNVCKFLPIIKIIIETASFDIQGITNSHNMGHEYGDGPLKDFENVRAYVLHRDGHACKKCGKRMTVLHAHHIETRKTGGNRPDNLITLCKDCHEKYHEGKLKLIIEKTFGFKAESFMTVAKNSILYKLRQEYASVENTFGHITKKVRNGIGIVKSHSNDAIIIAGYSKNRCATMLIKQKRKNNRHLQTNKRGVAIAIRRKRYKIQTKDILKINGKEYLSRGCNSFGRYVSCFDDRGDMVTFKTEDVERVFHSGGFLWPIIKVGIESTSEIQKNMKCGLKKLTEFMPTE